MRSSKTSSRKDLDKIAERFTLQAVLNILADFDVVHIDMPPQEGEEKSVGGIYSADHKKVWVDTKLSYYARIRTVIHEFWHAYSDLNYLNLTESQVRYLEREVDKKLFPNHSHLE